jgi:hypothetical protein
MGKTEGRDKTYLGESLLLQIRDDALPEQSRSANDIQHLLVVVLKQRELEAVLRRVEGDGPGACRTVQTMHCLALDAGQVYRVIQRADYAMVAAFR